MNYKTSGVCSQQINFDIEGNKLKNVQFTGSIVITKTPECEQKIIADKLWYTATDDVVVDQDTNWNIKYNK